MRPPSLPRPTWDRLPSNAATIARFVANHTDPIARRIVRPRSMVSFTDADGYHVTRAPVDTDPIHERYALLVGGGYVNSDWGLAADAYVTSLPPNQRPTLRPASMFLRQGPMTELTATKGVDMYKARGYVVRQQHPDHPGRVFVIGQMTRVSRNAYTGAIDSLTYLPKQWAWYDLASGVLLAPSNARSKESALNMLWIHMHVQSPEAVTQFLNQWAAHKASKILLYTSGE